MSSSNSDSPSTSMAFIRTLLQFTITLAVGLITIWLSLDRMVLEKVATALVLPVGFLWLLLLFLCAFAVAIRQRFAAAWLFVFWILFSAAGSSHVANWAAASLEETSVGINPLQEEPYDFVVVLGGGGGLGANGRMQGNGSGDRMLLAAQLYHAGVARRLICTGQRIASMNSTDVDPGDVSLDILTKLGVPADVIEKAGGRNTSEELQSLGERFGDSEQRVGLITSAWHMPRALGLARRNGFHPNPLPADFRSPPRVNPPTPGEVIASMIPGGDAVATNSALLKEYLGMLAGR